jgi:hypothetical protein
VRKLTLGMLALVFGLALVEGLSYGVGRFLARRGVLYEPQIVDDYGRYLRERNPVTGWPSPLSAAGEERDETGSRIVPAFPEPRDSCLSLYGDSFTWAGPVHELAWGNVLSELLGCRVANYGVSGFGSDQAYLRFAHNARDAAPVAFLGHQAENILRNANQLRGLLYNGTVYGLKPRFVLGADGGLDLVPLPRLDEAGFRDLVMHPERYLAHEFFLPGGPAGTVHLRFPYTLSVLSAYRNFHIRAELRGEPWHAAFYAPDHPAQALEITARIFEAFDREARRRGKVALLAIIPNGSDFEYRHAHRRWVYQPLLDRVRGAGLDVLDVGEGMLERLGGRDPCALFADGRCEGHPNAEGYAILAQVVKAHLVRRGLVPDPIAPVRPPRGS